MKEEETITLKKRYKKTILTSIILVLALILVIALIAAYLLGPGKYNAFIDKQYEQCASGTATSYSMILAIKTGNEDHCKKMDGQEKDLCTVFARKNAAGCRTIGLDEANEKKCLVILTKDPLLCEEEDYRCLAEATGDESYCLRIRIYQKDLDEQKRCIALATLNETYFLNEKIKTECYDKAYLLATYYFKNKKFCGNIISQESREQCLETEFK